MLILESLAKAFTSNGFDMQALYGSQLEVSEVSAEDGSPQRWLQSINIDPEGDIMKVADGLIDEGEALLHVVATSPSEAVEGLQNALLELFKTPQGGLGKPGTAPTLYGVDNSGGGGSDDRVTVWEFNPTPVFQARASRFGQYWRATQQVQFAARAGDWTT